jgi:hypothetical protein
MIAKTMAPLLRQRLSTDTNQSPISSRYMQQTNSCWMVNNINPKSTFEWQMASQ